MKSNHCLPWTVEAVNCMWQLKTTPTHGLESTTFTWDQLPMDLKHPLDFCRANNWKVKSALRLLVITQQYPLSPLKHGDEYAPWALWPRHLLDRERIGTDDRIDTVLNHITDGRMHAWISETVESRLAAGISGKGGLPGKAPSSVHSPSLYHSVAPSHEPSPSAIYAEPTYPRPEDYMRCTRRSDLIVPQI